MSRFDLQPNSDWSAANKLGGVQERKAKLNQLLGLGDRPPVPVQATHLQTTVCGSYVEEKYALAVGGGVEAPLYLLIPETAPPHTPVLAFHGHDPGVDYVLGHYPDEATAVHNYRTHNNYAQALAQAGYLVCALEQRGMGERLTEQRGDTAVPRSCRHLAFSYMLQGRTLLGQRCWDGICAINYLQSRSDVRQGVLGCTGHSGGGTTTLFLAAIEERITAAVVSGYFSSFRASILEMAHCECNYVPGILQLGEMGDIAALIAPRPLCLVNGRHDPLFPVQSAKEQFKTVATAYAAYGRDEAAQLIIHAGEHAYYLPAALDWFARWLAGP